MSGLGVLCPWCTCTFISSGCGSFRIYDLNYDIAVHMQPIFWCNGWPFPCKIFDFPPYCCLAMIFFFRNFHCSYSGSNLQCELNWFCFLPSVVYMFPYNWNEDIFVHTQHQILVQWVALHTRFLTCSCWIFLFFFFFFCVLNLQYVANWTSSLASVVWNRLSNV